MATARARPRRRLAAVAALLGLTAALASCADDPDSSQDVADDASSTASPAPNSPRTPATSSTPGPTTEPTSEPTSDPSSEPTEPSTESTPPAPESTTPSSRPRTLRSALVPGSQLPPLNLENLWRTAATSTGEPDPPAWVCQPVSLVSYGAVTSWSRTYSSAGTSRAHQVVARFADTASAKRGFGSLQGNARNCADELTDRGRRPQGGVQPLTALEVPGGQAGWGVVYSGPVRTDPDAAHIDAVVVVRVRDLVSVVSMHSIGQDYNYEPGQTPPELAGPIVADRLAAVTGG